MKMILQLSWITFYQNPLPLKQYTNATTNKLNFADNDVIILNKQWLWPSFIIMMWNVAKIELSMAFHSEND